MKRKRDLPDESILDAVDDEVFVALRDRTRRLAIYFLGTRRSSDPNVDVGLEELANVVTGWHNAGSRGMATREDRDRVHAALTERHLPVMVDAGLVVYDEASGTVSLDCLSEPVRTLLDIAYASEGDTSAPY